MPKSKYYLIFIFLLSYSQLSTAQNSLGLISYTEMTAEGYTMFAIHEDTYLINNCGEIVNQWTSQYLPGNSVYLLEDGSILRTGETESTDINFGGVGGVIERYTWEGDLIWQYFYDTPQVRQHHDIYPLPNGNVLILAAEVVSKTDAIELGRDPDKLLSEYILNEIIIEVAPLGFSDGSIVWKWSFFDHLIQDFDPTKQNYGVISENPQLVDFNYVKDGNDSFRWLHINSIQYYEEYDQIVLSSRLLNEFYIIDHSTTTSEANSTSGGKYGKGGDFLYRWGNPQIYGRGSEENRQLGGQHYPHFIEPGLPDEGSILLFDNYNNPERTESAVLKLDIPQSSPGVYIFDDIEGYGPDVPSYSYTNGSEFFSAIVSSAQALPNGNLLLCEGASGEITEISPEKNIVWKYTIPVSSIDGTRVAEGQSPANFQNTTFRAIKYPKDYPAFENRDLDAGETLELNADVSSCLTLSNENIHLNSLRIYPIPSKDLVYISSIQKIENVEVFDIRGSKYKLQLNNNTLNIETLASGVYFLKLHSGNKSLIRRIVKD